MDDTISKIKSLRKAVSIILKFIGIDLTININQAHYGLRFYTLFNRLDVVNNKLPILLRDSVYMDANITVPNGYTPPRFDNTNRDVVLPLNNLQAIALVVKDGCEKAFVKKLQRAYCDRNDCCSCLENYSNVSNGCFCFEDFAHRDKIYEVFVDAIDRSNNPLRGKVVAYDSQVIWLQAIDKDTPPTFYLVPIEDISFIALYRNRN